MFDAQAIIRAVSALGFPPGSALIHASAAMVLHGIIPLARDIDIATNGPGWQHALTLGTPRLATVDQIVTPAKDIEVFSGWLGEDTGPLFERAENIAGLLAASTADILRFKQRLNRPKDQEHIRLLEACNNQQLMSAPLIPTSKLQDFEGQTVTVQGWVHNRRNLGGIRFLLLRDRMGLVQCVFQGVDLPLHESSVRVTGKVVPSGKAPGGLELQATQLELVTEALQPPPVEISKEEWLANPDTLLQYRSVSIRGLKARAALKVQAEIVRAFRAFLDGQGFTEIFTPKIVAAGAEGGANMFELDFYGKKAFLAQSPQLYKQMMVAVFERVYETAPVYRAELSHTNRHLSEYLSLDVEMAFIRDDSEVMDLQEQLIRSVMQQVASVAEAEFALLDASPAKADAAFPRIPLLEARALVRERYGHESGGKDLDPEAERLIARWALEEHGSDFVFVTDYPQEARPFYTYPQQGGLTRGVDLIFRGMEISSGGQRAHEFDTLVAELQKRNLDPADFSDYLEVFRHGMPPHGGFALGAERLTALLLGISNVRFARAFPRDAGRLQP